MVRERSGVGRTTLVMTALALAFLGLGLRLAYVALNPVTFRSGLGGYGDTGVYMRLAANLVDGHGYSQATASAYDPSAYKPPLYGLFLAGLFKMEAGSLRDIRFIQAGLDSLSVVCVFAVAWLLTRRLLDAVIAGCLMAFCPYAIHYARALLSDWMGATLAAGGMAAFAFAVVRRRWAGLIAAGIVFGGMILTRPVFLFLPFVLGAGLLFAWLGSWKQRSAAALLFLGCSLVLPGAWTVRNMVTFDRFIPVSAGGMAVGLLRGTWETPGNWSWTDVPRETFATEAQWREVRELLDRYRQAAAAGRMDEVFALNAKLKQKAYARIRAHPLRVLGCAMRRVPLLWWQHDVDMYRDPDPGGAWAAGCLAAALLSLGLCWPRGWRLAFLWVWPVYVTLMHLPAHVEPRFTLPALPALAVLAGGGLGTAYRWLGAAARRFASGSETASERR